MVRHSNPEGELLLLDPRRLGGVLTHDVDLQNQIKYLEYAGTGSFLGHSKLGPRS